jgi:hypothetical protein
MKTNITSIFVTAVLLAGAVNLVAGDTPAPNQPSPEFERMKSLIGTWTGKADIGQGPIEMTVQYRLIAGGTVLEEKVFPGTPNEMVTMYFDKGGKLALTHYCIMGNQPGMVLKSADSKTLHFDFDKSCGINPTKESHMHAMNLTFKDTDTIVTSCKAIMNGQEVPEHETTLKRVRS